MGLELYPHQVEAIKALESGKKFLISIMGSGKGACMLHWLKSTGKKKWLIVTTAAKRDEQSIPAECDEWFGKEFRESLSSFSVISWAGLRGTKRIPNWFNEHRKELDEWAIAFDECLVGNSLVQAERGETPIYRLKVGDRVWSYNEKTDKCELKTVTRLIKKPMPCKMYCLRWHNGAIISTGNHPHYTQRGWVAAEDIKAGDILYEMHLLRERHPNRGVDTITESTSSKTRKNILQSRVQPSLSRQNSKRTDEIEEPNAKTGVARQSSRNQENERCPANMDSQTRIEGRQQSLYRTANNALGSSKEDEQRVGDGASNQSRETSARISQMLQSGYWQHIPSDSCRVRWAEPQQQSSGEQRQEENREITGVRVESIEVLEPRDIGERGLCCNTDYVYCIDVEDNHNFFANGVLTHNCHNATRGISSSQGTQFLKITNFTDCWTGYTATPAENWLGYYPYFTACKFVKNKTEFKRRFVIETYYKGYPDLVGYQHEDVLRAWWDKVSYAPDTSEMGKSLPAKTHIVKHFKKPAGYDKVDRTGYDLDGNFIETNSGLRHYLRRMCASKEKLEWIKEFLEGIQESCVIFYTYMSEGDELEAIIKKDKTVGKVWRISGSVHDIPTKDTIGKKDVVLAQWVSGSNSINLQFINYWVSVTPHDSYRVSDQARGRIWRIGATKPKIYYYLRCDGTEEDNIYDNLKAKGEWSTKAWVIKRKAEGKYLPE